VTARDLQAIDLAIVTAMEDELTPVLNLIGGEERWRRTDIDGFVHRDTIWSAGERSLTVVATALWKYGDNPTTGAVHRLRSLRPKLIAMSGICAGWLGKDGIALGDVLIAERAFNPAAGKQEGGVFRPDTHTYSPPAWLIQQLNDFAARDKGWQREIKTPRPVSLRYQTEWLLCKLSSRDSKVPFPTEADRHSMNGEGVDFEKALERLVSLKLVTEDLALTPDGQNALRAIQSLSAGALRPLKDALEPKARVVPYASGAAVLATEDPFASAAAQIRKTRAYDMEVKSFFEGAYEIGVPAMAFKGVTDGGTIEKDDQFREYACEAAARCLYRYVQEYAKHWPQSQSERAKLEMPTFRQSLQTFCVTLGGMAAGFKLEDLTKEPQTPFRLAGFHPIRFYVENNHPYADVSLYAGLPGLQPIELKHNELINKPPFWDINSNQTAMEVVNERQQPIFQLYYKDSTHIVVNGIFQTPTGILLANEPVMIDRANAQQLQEYRLKRLFKYPAWKYPGQYEDQ
jgi:nucleoside phosphorylase